MERKWQFSLKAWEFIFLSSCVLLALFCSYFFGYRAGHAVGYEDSTRASLDKTARYEVFEDAAKDLDNKSLDQIYASLNSSALAESDKEDLDETDLAAINTIRVQDDQKVFEQGELKSEPMLKEETIELISDSEEEEDRGGAKTISLVEETAVIVEEPVQEVKEIIEEKPEPKEIAKVEEPVKEVEKEASMYTPLNVPAGWYVQVATSKSSVGAQKLVASLKSSGFPARIESIQLGSKEFFRVLVGPEQKKDYANRLVTQLGRERYLSGKPFIRNIR